MAPFALGQFEPQRHFIALKNLLRFGRNNLDAGAFRGVELCRWLAAGRRDRRAICDGGLVHGMNAGGKHGEQSGYEKNQQGQEAFRADPPQCFARPGKVLGVPLGCLKEPGTGGKKIERAESEHCDEYDQFE